MNDKPSPKELPPVPSRWHLLLQRILPVTGEKRPYFGLVLMISISLLSGFLLAKDRERDYTVRGLSKSSRVTLKKLREIDGRLEVRLKRTKKKDSFLMLSNYKYNAYAQIYLESIPKRLLSTRQVRATSQAYFSGGRALFKSFRLMEGSRLTPGEYRYKVSFVPRGPKYRKERFLYHFLGYHAQSVERKPEVYEGKIIVFAAGERAFNKALKKYHKRLAEKLVEPLRERLGRYQTFHQLAHQSFEHYKGTLAKIKIGKDISRFEDLYNRDVGPLLRDLIIDANRTHVSYLNIDPSLSKAYEELMSYGKRIGEMASDMVTVTRQYKKIDKAGRAALLDRFKFSFNKLNNKVLEQKSLIEKELRLYPGYSDAE